MKYRGRRPISRNEGRNGMRNGMKSEAAKEKSGSGLHLPDE